jgi:uncharacterized protein (DUF2141 family)
LSLPGISALKHRRSRGKSQFVNYCVVRSVSSFGGFSMRLSHLRFPVALVLALGPAGMAGAQLSGRLGVSVGGLRSDNGVVRCGLYASANGFREPGREFRGAVGSIHNGQATCVFAGLPAGTYAVAVFHAENNETQMPTVRSANPSRATDSRAIRPRPSGRPTLPALRSPIMAAI